MAEIKFPGGRGGWNSWELSKISETWAGAGAKPDNKAIPASLKEMDKKMFVLFKKVGIKSLVDSYT